MNFYKLYLEIHFVRNKNLFPVDFTITAISFKTLIIIYLMLKIGFVTKILKIYC